MLHWSVRFTDAVSNFGWSGAFWAATTPIAESAMAEARQMLMAKLRFMFSFPILDRLNGFRNSSSVGQRVGNEALA
jgi:hypothetical protein